jgi:hypothetical protein
MRDPKYEKLIERTKEGRFKPGVSGNPSRQTKTKRITEAYKARLGEVNPDDTQEPKRTFAQCIADAVMQRAMKGDITAAMEICNRVEGMVRHAIVEPDDPYAAMSVEELEQELERTRTERPRGVADPATSPDGGYKQ